jgi:signal transduction histidine kinase
VAPRRFRRRLLLITVAALVVLIGMGVAVGLSARGTWRGWSDGGHPQGQAGWAPLGFLWFVLVVGGGATFVAYRRISRPVADLLGAADRLAAGDYAVEVPPSGPRELRTLTRTFNEMAARLADTEEQRRRFLADVTHELRTPLAVLQSGIEAQLDGIHPRDDAHLASLLEETQILGRLIGDLHTLALADAGRLALHTEPSSVPALVEDEVAGHRALAERRRIALTVEVDGDIPELDVDPTRIRQVLANLLANAVRHTPDGGTVRVVVAVEAPAGEVRVTVTDSGPGFPADRLDHLFDRSAQPADSRRSGLGLSIARDLVAAHHGTIEAWNETGGGATVRVALPTLGARGR